MLDLIAYMKFQHMSLPLPLKYILPAVQLHRNVVGVTVILPNQYSMRLTELELCERTGVCALRHCF